MKKYLILLSALFCAAAFGAASNTVENSLKLYHEAVEAKNIEEIVLRHQELRKLDERKAFKVSQSDPKLLTFIAELKPEEYGTKNHALSLFPPRQPIHRTIMNKQWRQLAEIAANLKIDELIQDMPINETSNTEQPAQPESHTDVTQTQHEHQGPSTSTPPVDPNIMEPSAALTEGHKQKQRELLPQLNNVSESITAYVQQDNEEIRNEIREQIHTLLRQISPALRALRIDTAEEDFITSANRFDTCITVLTEQAIADEDVETLGLITEITTEASELGQRVRLALTRLAEPAPQHPDNDNDERDPGIQAAIEQSQQPPAAPQIQQGENAVTGISSGLRTFLCWGTAAIAVVAVGTYLWHRFKK